MRVADFGLVVLVDHAVAIHVYEFQVARLDGATLQGVGCVAFTVLIQISLHVGGVLHDTFRFIGPEITDRVSYFHTGYRTCVLGQYLVRT